MDGWFKTALILKWDGSPSLSWIVVFRPISQCYQPPARILVAKIEWPSVEQLDIKIKICQQNKHQHARMPTAKYFFHGCWHGGAQTKTRLNVKREEIRILEARRPHHWASWWHLNSCLLTKRPVIRSIKGKKGSWHKPGCLVFFGNMAKHGCFHSHVGTPSYDPFQFGMFPYQPSSSWGSPISGTTISQLCPMDGQGKSHEKGW